MPLYEYQCDACGHRFEVIRKFSDVPLDACPKCGGAVQKLQSAPAFQFKGTGWYITDYAKKDRPTGAGESGKKGDSGKEKDASKDAGAAAKATSGSDGTGASDAKSKTSGASTGGDSASKPAAPRTPDAS